MKRSVDDAPAPFRLVRRSGSDTARIVFRGTSTPAGLRPVLDLSALASLRSILAELRKRPAALVVVESALEGFFAAGADLRMLAKLTPEGARELAEAGQRTFRELDRLPSPTVALVDGAAYGGGLDLALACRNRVATPRATFAHPGVKLGIVTGWGGTVRLPKVVGRTEALRILATGDPVDAEEALRIGLVSRLGSVASLRRRLSRSQFGRP